MWLTKCAAPTRPIKTPSRNPDCTATESGVPSGYVVDDCTADLDTTTAATQPCFRRRSAALSRCHTTGPPAWKPGTIATQAYLTYAEGGARFELAEGGEPAHVEFQAADGKVERQPVIDAIADVTAEVMPALGLLAHRVRVVTVLVTVTGECVVQSLRADEGVAAFAVDVPA